MVDEPGHLGRSLESRSRNWKAGMRSGQQGQSLGMRGEFWIAQVGGGGGGRTTGPLQITVE